MIKGRKSLLFGNPLRRRSADNPPCRRATPYPYDALNLL